MSEDRFLAGVYRTSAVLWLAVGIVLAAARCWSGLIGWTIGSTLSFGVVRSLEVVIRRSFVAGNVNAGRSLTRLSLVKLPVIFAVLMGVAMIGRRDLVVVGAFCAGAVLVQLAMVLNTLGSMAACGFRARSS